MYWLKSVIVLCMCASFSFDLSDGHYNRRQHHEHNPSKIHYIKTKSHVQFPPNESNEMTRISSGTTTHTMSLIKSTSVRFNGGCQKEPLTPVNSALVCSPYSGCRADCLPQYKFPNGMTTMFITCRNGHWLVDSWEDFEGGFPPCLPICSPTCRNNGVCTAPNQCQCPENYSGPQCEFEDKPCLNYPQMPINSRRTCRSKQCTVTCLAGHRFPDGSSISVLNCRNGSWIPAKEKWSQTTVPDCEPICQPMCENGGTCLSLNVCQCLPEYRGPQCQYRTDTCSGKNMNFNGGYNCSGDSNTFNCKLKCPKGIDFEFKPAEQYRCSYDQGVFLPQPIPQCKIPDDVEIVPLGGSSQYFYEINITQINIDSSGSFRKDTQRKIKWENFTNEELLKPYYTSSQWRIMEDSANEIVRKTGKCLTWNGIHYRDFKGRIFTIQSDCKAILAQDLQLKYTIYIQNEGDCLNLQNSTCSRKLTIFLENGDEYILSQSPSGGIQMVNGASKVLPLPVQLPGIRAFYSGQSISISLDIIGVKILWDSRLFIQIEMEPNKWDQTTGLCASNNTITKETFFNVKDLGNDLKCKVESKSDSCSNQESLDYCIELMRNENLGKCGTVLDRRMLLDACKWDYCKYTKNPKESICQTLRMHLKLCPQSIALSNWLQTICPLKCEGNRIYKSCGPSEAVPTCSNPEPLNSGCVEGCFCPDGWLLENSTCVKRENCHCKLRGKSYGPLAKIRRKCNRCTCLNGQWNCSQKECGARCSAIGDPHYTTFDGRKFDFMGHCQYYLVDSKENNLTILAENVPCPGTISEAMHLPVSLSTSLPSCTKTVTIIYNELIVKLKQNFVVSINDNIISNLPLILDQNFGSIGMVSSIFLRLNLTNGVQIWWDGVTRVYIDLSPNFHGKTRGLCGTFNSNQNDDFLTPDGDVEDTIIPFANKWKTSEKCTDVTLKQNHPCGTNPQNRPLAEELCGRLRSRLFEKCHLVLDPEPFYRDCLFDMCSCASQMEVPKCLCPILAAYNDECTLLGGTEGKPIDWRRHIPECTIQCPPGQVYQICGNSCGRTCADIIHQDQCHQQCVEGCNCPTGFALNTYGTCIQIEECQCIFEGIEFPADYKTIRTSAGDNFLCTCSKAQWQCRPASLQEIKIYPNTMDLRNLCNRTANFQYTTCEPPEPKTCRNMHSFEESSPDICHSGCKCRNGYVFDSSSSTCVEPTKCPCHHGGKSYYENDTILQNAGCNKCKCQLGRWQCQERPCKGECSTWGDSHYKTFDGRQYDFQGQCDYILAKGRLRDDNSSFLISTHNVPCSTLGTTCSKSITIQIRTNGDADTITFSSSQNSLRDNSNWKVGKLLTIWNKGLLTIVEAPELGLVLHWDREIGSRVYIKLDSRWKSKINGLCGNFNGNDGDDFETPSSTGTALEVSPQLFGDSWKVQDYCPPASDINSTCEARPERYMWAMEQCSVLKAYPFSKCHSEVAIDVYLEKCIFDSCACDQGGDCKCLCTALAAYAQECNNYGVPIRWRSQHLCPMQCDENCAQYEPCTSSCAVPTCENLLDIPKLSQSCQEDTCIESCVPKLCPEGSVYVNGSYLECVPKNLCKIKCLYLNGVQYYEGDQLPVDQNKCQNCFCSHGEQICMGTSICSTTPMIDHQLEEVLTECIEGWTNWLNQDKTIGTSNSRGLNRRGKRHDFEPLPSRLLLRNSEDGFGRCNVEDMVDIECRTVGDHKTHKETGLDAICSLSQGLICKSTNTSSKKESCPDFEIRVKCRCSPELENIKKLCGNHSVQYHEHSSDCHLFYQCDGLALVQKSCGSDRLYNPAKMICDWPYVVNAMKPQCVQESSTLSHFESTTTEANEICPIGTVPKECARKCSDMCLHYVSLVQKHFGHCLNNVQCEMDCIKIDQKLTTCPSGMKWANNSTCVPSQECLCTSKTGKLVKPGEVIRESECTICQCIDNFYSCDDTQCQTTTLEVDFFTTNEINQTVTTEIPDSTTFAFITSFPSDQYTFTTPEIDMWYSSSTTEPSFVQCTKENLRNLIQGDQPLPDSVFKASSTLNEVYSPSKARILNELDEGIGGNWAPKNSNRNQYLEVTLPQIEMIYGIAIKGSPLYDEYVTSYKILYKTENENFKPYLQSNNQPKIFRGSFDPTTPIKQFFSVPFEAISVRIQPFTWHKAIALRTELFGCNYIESSTIIPLVTANCTSRLSSIPGFQLDKQIKLSSEYGRTFGKTNVLMGNEKNVWRPLNNNPTEFIQFDLLQESVITGFISRGGSNGWVTILHVEFSQNGRDWSNVLANGKDKIAFVGNFDTSTIHTQQFPLPINARFLKFIPVKWFLNIQIELDVLGCFPDQFPNAISTTTPFTIDKKCKICSGLEYDSNCEQCLVNGTWWNSKSCVNRTECPCIEDGTQYPIGTIYQGRNCTKCVCKIGGTSYCKPKQCSREKCLINNHQIFVTSTCQCQCKPCPKGTLLCPTNNICINSTLFCNGIQDCPDDEKNCTKVVPTEPPLRQCVRIECPSGFTKVEVNTTVPIKKLKLKKVSVQEHLDFPSDDLIWSNVKYCPQFECVPDKPSEKYKYLVEECPPAVCPYNFHAKIELIDRKRRQQEKLCPQYTCHPVPPEDSVCQISEQMTKTFDGTTFRYKDVCFDHLILIRDLSETHSWDVTGLGWEGIQIRQDEKLYSFHRNNSTVTFDGYNYDLEQFFKRKEPNALKFQLLGGQNVLIKSELYSFWIILSLTSTKIQLGLSQNQLGSVDGTCGYFNGKPEDDKQLPNGTLARNTKEFFQNWQLGDSLCNQTKCDKVVERRAKLLCGQIRETPFKTCSKFVNFEEFLSKCLSTSCQCLSNRTENECRCEILSKFVSICLLKSNFTAIDQEKWRSEVDCPHPICTTPENHYDCYRKQCEPTCSNGGTCLDTTETCLQGCYCPNGYVRNVKNGKCIPPAVCRNCECNLLPNSKYVTFDQRNFMFHGGHCVYVMARDKSAMKQHKFQVLVTHIPCKLDRSKPCIGKITILFNGHKIHILRQPPNRLRVIIDGERLRNFQEVESWLQIEQIQLVNHLRFFLRSVGVEITIYSPSLGVSIKAASEKYHGQFEGLCGDCNKDPENDMQTQLGTIVNDLDEFANNWLYENLPGGQSPSLCAQELDLTDIENCKSATYCSKQLLNDTVFGKCARILNPDVFLDWCEKDTVCGTNPKLACSALEAYAKECAKLGICVKNWRDNGLCPPAKCPVKGQVLKTCNTELCHKICQKTGEVIEKCSDEEDCVCPKRTVLLNGTCVPEKQCFVCDDLGHYDGQIWRQDKCTTCSCVGMNLKCESTQCAELICDKNYQLIEASNSDSNECCKKYICVPEPTESPVPCEQPQIIKCASDQTLKLDTKPNGCQQFICECKPVENCESLEVLRTQYEHRNLAPGFVSEIDNTTGCCPQIALKCYKDLCPKPQSCPEFYTLQELIFASTEANPNQVTCCPMYECVPPSERCIYQMQFTSGMYGGERPRDEPEKYSALKTMNENWSDGPCRKCNCNRNLQVECVQENCPKSSLDDQDYDMKEEFVPDQCCPIFKRVACKSTKTIQRINEEWTDPNDPCVVFVCTNQTGTIEKIKKITECDLNCDRPGYQYQKDPNQCCGICKQITCIDQNGIERAINEQWISKDFCTQFICTNTSGTLQIQSNIKVCPNGSVKLDLINFHYEPIATKDKCCKSKLQKVACRDFDGQLYKVDEKWYSPNDSCKLNQCVAQNQDLVKLELIQACEVHCEDGWQYQQSKNISSTCCGKCVQIGCWFDGKIRKSGEIWTNSNDNCTKFICEKIDENKFVISSQQESCPLIDLIMCPEDQIYVKGCCKYCNTTSTPSQVNCIAEPMALNRTRGIVKGYRPSHGKCINKDVIKEFHECVGACHSGTYYDIKSGYHEVQCTCCQAIKYSTKFVELECDDGFKWKRKISVPSKCSCLNCNASPAPGLVTGAKLQKPLN